MKTFTEETVVTRIYSHMKQHSIKRGHRQPNFTREELREWLFNQPNFRKLYSKYVASDFNKLNAPSCNRLDDTKGYDLTRLELISWREHIQKSADDRKHGASIATCKEVISIDDKGTIEHFHSIKSAARKLAISDSNISKVLRGQNKFCGGRQWHYYNS